MARNERQDDATRGGVGTMTRTGLRPRQAEVPPRAVPPRAVPADAVPDQRRGRQARSGVPPQRTAAGKRAARAQQSAARPLQDRRPAAGSPPAAGQRLAGDPRAAQGRRGAQAVPNAQGQPQPAAVAAPAGVPGTRRMPFVLLLCGLLGGALVSALVISTTLAEGTFEITNLQQSTNSLARTRQALQEQVAQASSAQVIEQRAEKLGMRPVGELRFIDLTTGKTSSDMPPSQTSVPGYIP